jgi:hypothetical protein
MQSASHYRATHFPPDMQVRLVVVGGYQIPVTVAKDDKYLYRAAEG